MRSSGGSWPRRIALDTSAYSHLRGGDERVVDLVEHAAQVLLPVTVLGELDAAFRSGSRRKDNDARLRELLEAPFVLVLEVTADVARRYGQVFARLRSNGTPVATNDVWIAATVIDAGAHLVTFDRDFQKIDGLDLTVLSSRP
ncbi:MAG: type II toxin-antitoxin system VapC family toxin [Deltaproteobacteria bacterium]|nr:type II toxin-antitoxin system VapC family toxin [Deltaproteobacteria bacterium]